MANIVWANNTGTWGTTTLWDYWDENTQSIQPYGQVPQVGDYVYANGYIITIPTGTTSIGNGTFSNGDNPYTGRNGGSFRWTAAGTYNISGNVEGYGYSTTLGVPSNQSNTAPLTLQGNIYSFATNGTCAVGSSGSGTTHIINGNLYGAYCLIGYWQPFFKINGNIVNNTANPSIIGYEAGGGNPNNIDITVNGDCHDNFIRADGQSSVQFRTVNITGTYRLTQNSNPFNKTLVTLSVKDFYNSGINISCTTANVSGLLKNSNNIMLTGTTINFRELRDENDNLLSYGHIEYESNANLTGIRFTNMNIFNADTFTWKDVTNPRTNPFIIITDWDLNNQIQYPPENRVVAGTPYAYNEKVGTFEVDYPQESVVLKDVTYDSGNKTGKLVVLPAELISRLLNCPTIETMQQLLIAHLNPETD